MTRESAFWPLCHRLQNDVSYGAAYTTLDRLEQRVSWLTGWARILLEAEPLRAIDDLRGRIWRRILAKEELPAVEREHAVTSTKLLAGKTVARVYSETPPGAGYEPAEPDLEDVYFGTMSGQIGRRATQQAVRLTRSRFRGRGYPLRPSCPSCAVNCARVGSPGYACAIGPEPGGKLRRHPAARRSVLS